MFSLLLNISTVVVFKGETGLYKPVGSAWTSIV